MILVLDNYDSFTYNLVQYAGAINPDIKVVRNDAESVESILNFQPERIIISPGPGRPENAGISVALIRAAGMEIPILGVCLGHQAIAAAFGGKIIQAPEIKHGKTDMIEHDNHPLFTAIPTPFRATRYHSLIVQESNLPDELEVIAKTQGLIMALRHRERPLLGVQFHPESILTEKGFTIIENFVKGIAV